MQEDYTPDQKAIYSELMAFAEAWNNQDVEAMRQIYTPDSEELQWLSENPRKIKGRIYIKVDDIVVFGEDAFAKIRVGGWNSKELASFIKQDDQWKLEFRSKGL